jgi:pentatricopeptide repeat protein
VAKAEAVLRAMRARGFRPRDYAYCGLIAAYSLGGDCASALAVRGRMAQDGAQATVHVYNALVAACERAGQFDRALELLRDMKREGLAPNGVTQQLMAAIGRKGAASVETQQLTAAAMSAALAAAGSLLIRAGAF